MGSKWAAAAAMAVVVGLAEAAVALAPEVASPAVSYSTLPQRDSAELVWWRESMKTHDHRMQWFRQARFGMFIHWGVYSQLEGVWNGQPVQGYAEHIQRKAKIPIETYKKDVAGQFNPTKFNADEWAQLCKEAGMGYMVITSKHHDGFAMFDSDVSDYDVVQATPWKHDPMKDLKEATRKRGIRFGFYYSQAWDWGHPDAPGNDWDFDNPAGDRNLHGGKVWWEASPQWVQRCAKYVDEKAIPQVQELIAKYEPDIIWFDTNSKMPPSENLRVLKAMREAGPNVVVNSRCVGSLADYQSTADRPAELPPHDGDWEAIPTTNESYGYHRADLSHKPVSHFIEILAKTAARGGNLMLNVGPRGDGTIDPKDVAILQGIGQWMKVNGESIHGTTRTPLPVQAWGESTLKGNTLYLHVLDWPSDGALVVGGLKSKVAAAHLLADSTRSPLKVERLNDLDVRISVPTDAPDEVNTVVAVVCEGDVVCGDDRLLSPVQTNTLRAFDAKLHGKTLKFGQGKRENAYVEKWSEADELISWPVRVTTSTTFTVSAVYDAEAASGGGTYGITVGSHVLAGVVRGGKQVSDSLGTVRLGPGRHDIRVAPVRIAGKELMRLRAVVLKAGRDETTSAR